MSIRDWRSFIENLWDWSILKGCFGNTSIEMSDLDGVTERNGHILIVETKRPGQELTQGQRILFEALARLPGVTILMVWGRRDRPEAIQFWGREKYATDLDGLRRAVARWFDYADGQNANNEKRDAA